MEVEDGAISGGPALNSGDHGNFSGSGSYTFRETGMTSTMTVTAPAAGTYPVWIRYAAGPLTPEENVTRSMGLTTNGSRQVVSYPLTGSWESWACARADVTLIQGANTIAISAATGRRRCAGSTSTPSRSAGWLADTCAPTAVAPGAARLFDGTFTSFDQWRKAGAGGFGHQIDCSIRGFRGPGSTWTQATTSQQADPYTLVLDWRRGDADDASSVHVGSSTNNAASPTTGYRVMIGASDTATVTSADGAFTQAADAAALAAAVHPVGQWNRYAVQVTPARIRVLLNGSVVNAVDRSVPLGGYVGLENRGDGSQVDFRDIQVQPVVDLGPVAGPARRATKADGVTPNPGGESTLAHLVADAQRWATRGASGGTARIAFVTPTALKGDLVPTGTRATYAQAAAVLDPEPLVNMRLTGAQVTTVLEQQWQTTSGGQVPTPAFVRLGASTGLTWTHDASRPQGDRITGVWLDGAALNPTGNYSVTVSQSLANGRRQLPRAHRGHRPAGEGGDHAVGARRLRRRRLGRRAARPAAVPACGRRQRPRRCPGVLRRRDDVRRRPAARGPTRPPPTRRTPPSTSPSPVVRSAPSRSTRPAPTTRTTRTAGSPCAPRSRPTSPPGPPPSGSSAPRRAPR